MAEIKSEQLEMSGPESGPVTGLTPAWPRTTKALAALQLLLQCSSCNKLLQEPVCLGGCEHVFCRACVADSIGNGCPVCHAPAWVKDLQPNRQLHNIVNLCNQLEAVLNNKGSAADKSNSVTPEMKAERETGKKWDLRTRFSPRSGKLKCVLDMHALKKDQKISPSSDLNETSSSVFEFLSSPSPPHDSPKRRTSDKSKQRVRKRLTDANKEWGFGKRTSKKTAREGDSPGTMDHDRVVSFSSQPMVYNFQDQVVVGEPVEELAHADAASLPNNVTDSNVESTNKNLGDNLSDACIKAAASSCEDVSPVQLAKVLKKEEHVVPLPTAHAMAKRLRKSSDSNSKTPSKKSKKGPSSCTKILAASFSKNMCEPTKSDTHQESATPLLLKSVLNESDNDIQAISSTESSYNTPSNKGNSERKQHATQKSPHTPRSTPKSRLAGSHTTPISPLTPLMKRNHKGETPLHIASIKGDVATVEQLLENGANPNIKDNAGWTPLHEACNHGHVKVVQMLLQFGVLVNTPGYENDSPLHDAVRNGHVDVIKLLVLHGASQDVINIFGLRPIDYANTEQLIAALKPSTKDENPVVEQCLAQASTSQRRDEPIMLLGSGLLPADKNKLNRLIRLLKVGSCTEFSTSVTHIIVPSDHALCTMKCLMGIISGCWFVDLQWVAACLECKDRVSEEDYEISSMTGPKRGRLNREQQLPKLFDGCHFYFMGSFKSCKKEDLVHLVKLGGGQVLARQPKPDSDVTQSINTVAYHASPGSDQSFCTQYIIYDKDSNYKPEKMRLGKVWTTHSAWLINCVKSFELLPVTES
ncbi:BRCA1-associated RING domain protein 1 isoform X1 [Mobula hypostoma]|uniref:BRCA1-associated RING domain protein 1 isoform X1 n=1 Tax=Mobula hypostoma TaxID=723540 RepID=UPI002FC2E9C9